ncbi:unnamed protein product (mitochondrion) [Plasmodiophora brassicae]|uniref:Uncharacterized protein n=1 Tax=Plasmodiophora brassicae TaxID=37360 RepID=A0A0G4ILS7_PLABS|nr:hypothetical protein PBRA_004823 [Plasmodiophora brassicae]SPQ93322.1 unnamed protein product [Plasmodiophora brassicae]
MQPSLRSDLASVAARLERTDWSSGCVPRAPYLAAGPEQRHAPRLPWCRRRARSGQWPVVPFYPLAAPLKRAPVVAPPPQEPSSDQEGLRYSRVDECSINRFRPRVVAAGRKVELMVVVRVLQSSAPISGTMASLADAIRYTMALEHTTCSDVLVVIDCPAVAPRAVAYLEKAGLLQSKCFREQTMATAHVFERRAYLDTLSNPEGAKAAAKAPPGRAGDTTLEIEHNVKPDHVPVAVVVRAAASASFNPIRAFQDQARPALTVSIPCGSIVSDDALSTLTTAMTDGTDLDAIVVVPRPVSIRSTWMSMPMIASNAFGWIVEQSMGRRQAARRAPPDVRRVSIVRSSPSPEWVTAFEPGDIVRVPDPETLEEAFGSLRNDKARLLTSFTRDLLQWTLTGMLEAMVSRVEAVLWLLNLSVIWAFVRLLLSIQRNVIVSLAFMGTAAFVIAGQIPLLTRPVHPRITLLASVWIMPALFVLGAMQYGAARGSEIARTAMDIVLKRRFPTTALHFVYDDQLADVTIVACGLWYVLATTLLAALHGRLLSLAVLLPHELVAFPGRYLSAMPFSIGVLPRHRIGCVALMWATMNAIAIVVLSSVEDPFTPRAMLVVVSIVLAGLSAVKLLLSFLNTVSRRQRSTKRTSSTTFNRASVP